MAQRFTTAIVTVGTSLLTNLRRLEAAPDFTAWLGEQPAGERALLAEHRQTLGDAARAARAGRWEDVGQLLASVGDSPRVLGAEVGSLVALRGEARYQGVTTVHLLHSDTAEGAGCARALQALLAVREGLLCHLVSIAELRGDREDRFRTGGLRNLVTALARIVASHGTAGLVVNATGGYKAQIAIATVFGQAFRVPVVYRFEEFKQFIELPPLPIQLDDSAVAEHLDLFLLDVVPRSLLEERFGKPLTESNAAFAGFRVFLDLPQKVDGVELYAISPLGGIVYERWLQRQEDVDGALPPAASQKRPSWGDHHRPAGVEALVDRMLAEHPWVKRVETRDAEGRTHRSGLRFRLDVGTGGRVPPVVGEYVRDNHPALLVVHTTARSRREQEVALRRLLQWGQGAG